MKKVLFNRIIALILVAVFIFPNTAITYAISDEDGQTVSYDAVDVGEGTSTTGAAISTTTTEAAIQLNALMPEEYGYDISWYTGDEDTNYVIVNADQLRGLSQLVNGTAVNVTSGTAIEAKSFSGKTVSLGNDIDLENEEWVPIGTSWDNKFEGIFDGGSKTISGIYVKDSNDYQGLFGYAGNGAAIKNINVQGSVEYIGESDQSYSAGIAAYVDNCNFENIINSVQVTNIKGYSGGISGFGQAVQLKNCKNEADITGGTRAGGIGGEIGYSSTLENCNNTGTITGKNSEDSVGGIIGYCGSNQLSNCKNSGAILGNLNVGGIVGESERVKINCSINIGEITGVSLDACAGGILGSSYYYSVELTNCFVSAKITGADNGYTGSIVGRCSSSSMIGNCIYYNEESAMSIAGTSTSVSPSVCFYLSEETVDGYNGVAKGSDSFKYGEITYILNKASNSDTVNWYQGAKHPELTDGGDTKETHRFKLASFAPSSKLSADITTEGIKVFTDVIGSKNIYLNEGTIQFTISGAADGEKVKISSSSEDAVTEEDGIYTVEISSEDVTILYGLESEFDGANINWYDPEQSSFKISDLSELLGVGELVRGDTPYGTVDFSGKTISLNNDILIEENWIPIGSEEKHFKGVFDGNSKTIGGLYINNKDSEKSYQGFFGYSEGNIMNLTVTGTAISSGNYVGGIAGYSSGEINNCQFGEADEKIKSSVAGSGYVGGIVGYSKNSIYSSSNYGDITGTGLYVGGIVGKIDGRNLGYRDGKGNKNYGSITGSTDYVGGIAGYSKSSRYNENYGSVSGGGQYTGGIVGQSYSNTEENLNKGKVEGSKDYVGGITGYANSSVNNNTNEADIINVEGKFTGGIAGYADGWSGVKNNTNIGNISSSGDYVGGIFGSSDVSISSCINEGDVISTGDYVGGWTGKALSNCKGEKGVVSTTGAAISGGNYVGAIAGSGKYFEYVSVDSDTKVEGKANVGGISGYMEGSSSFLRYSYSLASVSSATGDSTVGGLIGAGEQGGKISDSFYYNDELDIICGNDVVEITNSYCLADDEYNEIRKSATNFSSGEIAWLLGGGDGKRNKNWTQEAKCNYPTTGNDPVYKVTLTESQTVEGNWLEMGDGTYGKAVSGTAINSDVTTGSALTSWYVYMKSGDTVRMDVTLTEGRTLLITPPLELMKEGNEYSFKVTDNFTGTYTFGIEVAPNYNWYIPGSETNTIKSESDLVGFSNLVNGTDLENSKQSGPIDFKGKTILLGNDIPMVSGNWIPIGNKEAAFKGAFNGAFNGQNKTISGLAILSANESQGLFGYISDAKISNLTVSGNIYCSSNNSGGVVGTVQNSSYFDNVHFGNEGSESSITGNSNTGGIIGRIVFSENEDEEIIERKVVIKNCESSGSVTGEENSVGGLIGYINNESSIKGEVSVENCTNNAKVTGKKYYVGGIVGQSNSVSINLINCINNGTVVSEAQYSAGIIGRFITGDAFAGKIKSCANNVNIISASNYAGGIAGSISGDISIENCTNKGSIEGNDYVGGITGTTGENSSISDNGNFGNVKGREKVGGISGYFDGKNLVRCFNKGLIEASDSNAGGIVGSFEGSKLSNCYNSGNVTATGSKAGGIAGKIDVNSSDGTVFMVSSCYNTSTITGSTDVGGITGENSYTWVYGGDNETASGVKFSYNIGKIVATSGVAGAISGSYYDLNKNNVCINSEAEYVDKEKVIFMEESQFASGEVSYYLDNGDGGDNRSVIWSFDEENKIPVFADSNNLPVYKITVMPSVGGKLNGTSEKYSVYCKAGTEINVNIESDIENILKLITVSNAQTEEVIFSDSNKDAITFEIPEKNSSDLIVSATFDKKGVEEYYSVKFISEDSTYSNQTVINGSKAAKPNEPTKEGYTFVGWYTADGGKWDFNTAVIENITLYAKWKSEGSVLITFNCNGGTFEGGNKVLTLDVKKGEIIPVPEDPSNGILEFKGWYTSKTNNIKLTSNTVADEDITYFAQWRQIGEFYPGSESEPYLIKSIEELISLKDQVYDGNTFKDYYFQLSDHIDDYELNDWDGIGGGSNYFEGNFDGSGVTINLDGSSGLFGSVSDAVIKNLDVEVNIDSNERVGGVANYAFARNSDVKILNCTVRGTISGAKEVGGIVGKGYADWGDGRYKYPVYVEGCTNEAEVSGSSNYDYVGGIVGFYYTDNYIKNTSNKGNIFGGGDATAKADFFYSKDVTGGIVGYGVYGKFESCKNLGKVSGNDYTGGLVGSVGTVDSSDYTSTIFINCYNAGEIIGDSYVGGLLGGSGAYQGAGSGTGRYTNFEDSYNIGNITASGSYVGGIAGQVETSMSGTSSHVYNVGDISGGDYVSGLIGHRISKDSANNCYNMGKITTTGTNVGAISGVLVGSTTDCYNLITSIENPLDIEYLTLLEEDSFVNGHAAYLLDGGEGERINYWTHGETHPKKGTPAYYKIELETDIEGGSINIDQLSEVYKGLGNEVEVNVETDDPKKVEENGEVKEYEYYLESLTVTQNGEEIDILESMKFEVSGDAYIEAKFASNEVINEPEIPVEPEKPVEPDDDEHEDDPEDEDDEDSGSGNGNVDGDGDGTGDGSGSEQGTGTSAGETEETESENPTENMDPKQEQGTEVNVEELSENNDNKSNEVVPVYSEIESKEEPEQETIEEPEDKKDQENDIEEDKEDTADDEEETQEVSSTPTSESRKNTLPAILLTIAAVLLIIGGIFRFILIKTKK